MENSKSKENEVLVAAKPISKYILATTKVFEKYDEVTLKARGKNINTLVNIEEILKRNGKKMKSVVIDTTSFKTAEGKDISISSMEIVMSK